MTDFNLSELQTGDIVLSKNYSWMGWIIAASFYADAPAAKYWQDKKKTRCSNHNAIFVRDKHGECFILECIGEGAVMTPITEYQQDVMNNKASIMFIRWGGGLSEAEQKYLWQLIDENLGKWKYDYLSFVHHIFYYTLRFSQLYQLFDSDGPGINSEREFYCTEFVQFIYQQIFGIDVFGKVLPAPVTVEKRLMNPDYNFRFIQEWHFQPDKYKK